MSITEKQNQDIIGRDEINNIEAILSIPVTPTNEIEHVVKNNADTIFTWDYSLARPQFLQEGRFHYVHKKTDITFYPTRNIAWQCCRSRLGKLWQR